MAMIVVMGAVLTGIAMGAPIAGLVSPGPGMNYPIIDNDGSRVNYGYGNFNTGWTVVDGVASLSGTGDQILYATLEDAPQTTSSITVMPDTEDWVFEIRHRVIGMSGSLNDVGWILKRYIPGVDPDDMPMFGLWKTSADADEWRLTGGGNYQTARYPTLVDGLVLGDGVWHTYTMHYRAAEQVMDAYMDGVLVAADIARTDGYYGANRLQVETMRTSASTTEVDYVILGQLVPEPATLVLLAMGTGWWHPASQVRTWHKCTTD